MYIKSIILDGFKSYGRRTEVSGFDPQFTAVTGLNGSGKSNIIDSICFVLGISNLSNVRVTNLQDLIYKSGQAGINKATVTIKFDNTDKNQAPPGFESYNEIVISRQIILGGKNKYLLNGLNVNNKRIQDLFCSIQLNVNNPHFLIMQGKITKVLNMKPPEILGMVEEAAGTKMYEVKRQAAVKNLEKKDSKLEELEKLFYEDVEPKITKLHEERTKVFELQKLEGELSHNSKLFEAWQCHIAEVKTNSGEDDIKKVEKSIQDIRDAIQDNLNNIKTLESEAEIVLKEAECIAGLNLKELETKLKEKVKHLAEINAIDKESRNEISNEERNIKLLEKNLKMDEDALKTKEQELEKVKNVYETLRNNENVDAEALEKCQKKYEAICVGMEVDETGKAQTLMTQLMNVKQEKMQVETDIKICQDELPYYQKQLKLKQKDLDTDMKSYMQDKVQLESLEKQVKKLKNAINELNYSEDHMNKLQEHREALKNDVRRLRDSIERFYASKPFARCVYTDPEPHFNRKNVHGVICDLIQVKNKANYTAIETAAGGMLYSVVVETDVVSKKLIERGQLQHRTTFIPLNKIRSNKMSPNIVQLAYNLVGKENVTPALDVISYDNCLQSAMQCIFGNVFITKDLNVAKKICFHEGIKKKCVTLDGDVVDPAGTLSGGSMQKGSSVLLLLEDIKKQEIELQQKDNEISTLQVKMQQMLQQREQWVKYTTELELVQHEYGIVSKRLEQSTHQMYLTEVEQLKGDIDRRTEKIKLGEQKLTDLQKVANDLEHKMKDSKGYQERQRRETEAELKILKKKAKESQHEWAQREEEYRTLNLEIEVLKKEIVDAAAEIQTSKENVVKLKQKHEESNEQTMSTKNIVKELQEAVHAEKATISAKNKVVQQKYRTKEKLIEQNDEHELKIKKLEYELNKVQDEQQIMKSRFKELKKKCKDINLLNEAQKMNSAEGAALEKKIREDMQRRNELTKTVNVKAHNLYEHEAKTYENLKTKISEVKKDVLLIKDAIKKLDKKKEEIVNKAFQQVTKDMGSILGTLLPGANAKLIIPHGKTILEGLEVKVALGGVWKESLDELSGGQRSLVALSLILAMLLFKPAPLYILDEVDAALDLSHTQNIGAMLKQHFKQSQFIIVSLKDGMFNNANVLFKTQFIDGVSAVSRSTNL